MLFCDCPFAYRSRRFSRAYFHEPFIAKHPAVEYCTAGSFIASPKWTCLVLLAMPVGLFRSPEVPRQVEVGGAVQRAQWRSGSADGIPRAQSQLIH